MSTTTAPLSRQGGVATEAPEHGGPPVAPRGLRGRPWLTLAVVALGVMMVGLDGTVVAIANPFIARSLHASLKDLQWITNAYLLVLAVLLIPGGKLGDRYGRRLVFLVGVTGFAASSLGVGLVGSTGGVIAFRALQGAFGALLMPNTLALLRSAFPAEKLNAAVGVWGGSSALAVAGGPILGGVLVEHVSWESVFYLNVPLGLLTVAAGLVLLTESRESLRQRFDIPGLVVLAAALFLVVFGVIQAQTWGWGDARTLGLLAAGLVALGAFVLVENRVAAPLLPLRLFRDRSVSLGVVTVMLNFFALFGVLFFISLYLQSVHGYSAVQAGVRTLPLTAVFVISSPISALLTTKFGPRVPITGGLLVVGLSLLGLIGLDTNSAYTVLWPPMVGLGLGIGLVVVASTEAIVGNTPVDDAGLAGGIQSTAVQLGGVLGSSILGSVLASRVGSVLVDKLVDAGVPPADAPQFLGAKQYISQGVAPVPAGLPPAAVDAITRGAHAAFMSGLHVALLVGAVVALLGACAGPFIRRGSSPMSAVTGV